MIDVVAGALALDGYRHDKLSAIGAATCRPLPQDHFSRAACTIELCKEAQHRLERMATIQPYPLPQIGTSSAYCCTITVEELLAVLP